MPVLTNRTRTIQVFNIPCRTPACDGTDCLCSVLQQITSVEMEDGKTGKKVVERRCPGTVQFLAGQSKPVPAWVAQSAPIKAALARGDLRLLQE